MSQPSQLRWAAEGGSTAAAAAAAAAPDPSVIRCKRSGAYCDAASPVGLHASPSNGGGPVTRCAAGPVNEPSAAGAKRCRPGGMGRDAPAAAAANRPADAALAPRAADPRDGPPSAALGPPPAARGLLPAALDALAAHAWANLDRQSNGVLLPTHVRPLLERGAPASAYDEAGRRVVRQILQLVLAPPLIAWLAERAAGGLALAPAGAHAWCRRLQPSDVPDWVTADGWADAVTAGAEHTLYVRLLYASHQQLAEIVAAADASLSRAKADKHVPYAEALARPRDVLRITGPADGPFALAYVGVHAGDAASAGRQRFDAVLQDQAELGTSFVMRALGEARDRGDASWVDEFAPVCSGHMPRLFASLAEAVLAAAAAPAALNCAPGGLLQVPALQQLVPALQAAAAAVGLSWCEFAARVPGPLPDRAGATRAVLARWAQQLRLDNGRAANIERELLPRGVAPTALIVAQMPSHENHKHHGLFEAVRSGFPTALMLRVLGLRRHVGLLDLFWSPGAEAEQGLALSRATDVLRALRPRAVLAMSRSVVNAAWQHFAWHEGVSIHARGAETMADMCGRAFCSRWADPQGGEVPSIATFDTGFSKHVGSAACIVQAQASTFTALAAAMAQDGGARDRLAAVRRVSADPAAASALADFLAEQRQWVATLPGRGWCRAEASSAHRQQEGVHRQQRARDVLGVAPPLAAAGRAAWEAEMVPLAQAVYKRHELREHVAEFVRAVPGDVSVWASVQQRIRHLRGASAGVDLAVQHAARLDRATQNSAAARETNPAAFRALVSAGRLESNVSGDAELRRRLEPVLQDLQPPCASSRIAVVLLRHRPCGRVQLRPVDLSAVDAGQHMASRRGAKYAGLQQLLRMGTARFALDSVTRCTPCKDAAKKAEDRQAVAGAPDVHAEITGVATSLDEVLAAVPYVADAQRWPKSAAILQDLQKLAATRPAPDAAQRAADRAAVLAALRAAAQRLPKSSRSLLFAPGV